MTTQTPSERLEHLCQTIPPLLYAIDEALFSQTPAPGKWSKLEIIGHLIDSANNNHQRFVRVQFEDNPVIWYDQNKWNEHGFYRRMPRADVIELWMRYNLHLARLMRNIPTDSLQRNCTMRDGTQVTLEFLIHDYVAHQEHHLRQVLGDF